MEHPESWIEVWCLKVVRQAYANRNWPVIGNSDEVEAEALAQDLREAWQASAREAQPAPNLYELGQAVGRLDEFLKMQRERPIDPGYWEAHEESRLREAVDKLRMGCARETVQPPVQPPVQASDWPKCQCEGCGLMAPVRCLPEGWMQYGQSAKYRDKRGRWKIASWCEQCKVGCARETKPAPELERYRAWKKKIDIAFTAGMLGMEHDALMGGRKLSARGFITWLKVAMREAETEFMAGCARESVNPEPPSTSPKE